ncbi:hypothetical protein COBT_002261 [Conglomerata obtusa]
MNYKELDDYLQRIIDSKSKMHKIIIDSRNKEIDNCKVDKDIEDLKIDEIVLKRKLGPEKGNKLESKRIGPFRIKHKGKMENYTCHSKVII